MPTLAVLTLVGTQRCAASRANATRALYRIVLRRVDHLGAPVASTTLAALTKDRPGQPRREMPTTASPTLVGAQRGLVRSCRILGLAFGFGFRCVGHECPTRAAAAAGLTAVSHFGTPTVSRLWASSCSRARPDVRTHTARPLVQRRRFLPWRTSADPTVETQSRHRSVPPDPSLRS